MIFIFLTIVGFILLIITVKLRIKKSQLKEIVDDSILKFPLIFSINEPGMYAISFIGVSRDFSVKNIIPKLISSGNNNLIIHEYSSKYNFVREKKPCSCQWYFFVSQQGNYELRFDNLEEFMLKYPILRSSKVKSRKFQTEKLGVLIKEGMTAKEYAVMFLSAAFGFQMFFFGIIMILKRYLF